MLEGNDVLLTPDYSRYICCNNTVSFPSKLRGY